MGFAGADWVEKSIIKYTNENMIMSDLGRAVADLLGDVFRGIYHLNETSLSKVDWTNKHYIKFTYYGELSTIDFNQLTVLVILAHDRMIRVSIQGIGPNYMRMLFHQRTKREGMMSERYPTMEDHIAEIRSYYR